MNGAGLKKQLIMNNMKHLQINQSVDDEVYNQIKELLNKKVGMWKPKNNEYYYYIRSGGDVERILKIINDDEDIERELIGNFYQTEAEALAKVEWLKAVQRIKEYIAREFGEYFVTSKDQAQAIYVDYFGKLKVYENDVEGIFYSPFGYLRSSDHAEQLIKDCEADLKIVFNVNK